MSTVQNGKGDRPRNNWGSSWYSGYDAIDWRRKEHEQGAVAAPEQSPTPGKPWMVPGTRSNSPSKIEARPPLINSKPAKRPARAATNLQNEAPPRQTPTNAAFDVLQEDPHPAWGINE
jgi:hypothetical protein